MSLIPTKYKFKERFTLVIVGTIFSVLLITETQLLMYITPVSRNFKIETSHGDASRNFDNSPKGIFETKTSKIFEEILKDLDSHIGVMRKELSFKNNNSSGIYDYSGNNNSSLNKPVTDNSDRKYKEIVANSKVVQKYAHVFLQIADLLSDNDGGKAQGHSRFNTSGKSATKQDNIRLSDIKGIYNKYHYKSNDGEIKIDENVHIYGGNNNIHRAWPKIGVFSQNLTISQLIQPNGYDKKAGTDFNLPETVIGELEKYAKILQQNHTEHNEADDEQLKLYPESYQPLPAWKKWHNSISRYHMYPNDLKLIDDVINDLRHQPPVECYEKPNAGTQFKLFYHFRNHGRALFKAIRFSKDQETWPDHYYFSDFERYNAELASFHLDRLLGFRRVPLTTGRVVNIQTEIEKVADKELKEHIMYSPAGNLCVRGSCDYYCDLHHMICGRPYLLEGVMMGYMPSQNDIERSSWKYPWARSYYIDDAADWETDHHYCETVRNTPPYNEGRRLLDIMDVAVLDFLTGNMDRHHYETFTHFGNDTFIMHLDNGKGFGSAYVDEMTCLYPIMQCCLIRYTTYQRLLDYHRGPISLGQALKVAMSDDPTYPVLLEPHYSAIDRRLKIILKEIHNCTVSLGYTNVVVDDGF